MQPSALRCAAIAAVSVCACALSAPADAQLLSHKDISAAIALTIVETAIYDDMLVKAPQGWRFKKRVVWRDDDDRYLQDQRLCCVGDRGRPQWRDHRAGARRQYRAAHHREQFS